jgi:calcineurin-like phosphoesterase family protein
MIPVKQSLYVIGDIHFSSMNEWSEEIGDLFIQWFDSLVVAPDSELILLGDLTEKDVNSGNVIHQLEKFFNICQRKFRKTYAVVGNHDKKLFKNRPQISFIYAKEKKGIQIVDDLSVITTMNGFKILFMPFIRVEEDTLNEFYSNLPEEYYTDSYDLVVGHFNKKSDCSIFMQDGADITKLKYKHIMLGHIHIRWDKDYLGSVWAQKISEIDPVNPRIIGVLSHDATGEPVRSEIAIPEFVKYVDVKYPEPIPIEEAGKVYIYTAVGCPNKGLAESCYRGKHIRGVSNVKIDQNGGVDTQGGSDTTFSFTNFNEAFGAMIKEQKLRISRPAFAIISNLFENKGI